MFYIVPVLLMQTGNWYTKEEINDWILHYANLNSCSAIVLNFGQKSNHQNWKTNCNRRVCSKPWGKQAPLADLRLIIVSISVWSRRHLLFHHFTTSGIFKYGGRERCKPTGEVVTLDSIFVCLYLKESIKIIKSK